MQINSSILCLRSLIFWWNKYREVCVFCIIFKLDDWVKPIKKSSFLIVGLFFLRDRWFITGEYTAELLDFWVAVYVEWGTFQYRDIDKLSLFDTNRSRVFFVISWHFQFFPNEFICISCLVYHILSLFIFCICTWFEVLPIVCSFLLLTVVSFFTHDKFTRPKQWGTLIIITLVLKFLFRKWVKCLIWLFVSFLATSTVPPLKIRSLFFV